MTNQEHNQSTPWGLLSAKAIIYVAIGVFIFAFSGSFTAVSGSILAGLFMLAGIFQLLFSRRNKSTDTSNIWGLMYGFSDIGFGIAILIYSLGDSDSIVQTLAFWALLYAILQSVQAMYSFIAARGGTSAPLKSMLTHGITVLVSGGMSYVLLTFATGFNESMHLSGLFTIGLGALLFVLIQLMRAQKANEPEHRVG
ncbi:DUF308 domain-containing protein [Spirosoma fluviale]|uniref:Acid-resistance membrane protein n=1 Tax=Spirosoma fluviale TaxID=1597977 RepID=A0A286GVI3_9BACT|nr:DUF308 domain-containing protein [Spirosoma fluviale]SOD99567.1 Short repeat of unknown function [Spirosoma fluviale]